MDFDLISEEDYNTLPEDPERCFVEFELMCRRNMMKLINDQSTSDFDNAVRQQYMAAVYNVALECGIPDIYYKGSEDTTFFQDFTAFSLAVQGAVARIRIRYRGQNNASSVLLTGSTRTKIEHYVSRIRDVVSKSDLEPDRKKQLSDKLDALLKEISGQRLSFARAMTILVGVATIMGTAVTIGADGKTALTNIMQLIGQDKETEEAAMKRLAPPPKALPAPTSSTSTQAFGQQNEVRSVPKNHLDDDIPF